MPDIRLLELYARSLGVIAEARVEFGPGFNVFTGETGAGKTMLLDALALCVGGEVSREAVREDTKAVALFATDDESRVLARESGAGRLRASLDGAPASAEVLRRVGSELLEVHGQHESLTLTSRAKVLHILDMAGGVSSATLDTLRRELSDLEAERASLGGVANEREREMEYLRFQLGEFASARVEDPGELDDTLEDLRRLSAWRDAQGALAAVVEALDGDNDEAVLARLAREIRSLPSEGVDDVVSTLDAALESARDAVHELARRADPDAVDVSRLHELDTRVETLSAIARKFGGTLAAALEQRDVMTRRYDELDRAESRLAEIAVRHEALRAQEESLSAEVRRQRLEAAEHLNDRLAHNLARVALANAVVRFEVEGRDGSSVGLVFSSGPGTPVGPLQSLASGGELSRVLLAISLVVGDDDTVAVFDEIDAGLGGQVAQDIGECLAEVGERRQVIAVTHLASVAARADHHFVLEKSLATGVAVTTVREVVGEERVREIARMLAGDESSSEALALARRLLAA